MERKIGAIFEYKGEWYQCIEGNCAYCSLKDEACEQRIINDVCKLNRIFKKLEKVGEPYEYYGHIYQEYHVFEEPIFTENYATIRQFGVNSKIGIEIKQNKEDMEEGKLDPHMEKVIDEAAQKLGDEISKQLKENLNKQRMKPFNLEAAKAGRPVCTRDGRKARIICFDRRDDNNYNIVALIEDKNREEVRSYYNDGKYLSGDEEAPLDLMMLPEKKEGWIIVSKNATIYDSLEDAKKSFDSDKELCICKVEWEE